MKSIAELGMNKGIQPISFISDAHGKISGISMDNKTTNGNKRVEERKT